MCYDITICMRLSETLTGWQFHEEQLDRRRNISCKLNTRIKTKTELRLYNILVSLQNLSDVGFEILVSISSCFWLEYWVYIMWLRNMFCLVWGMLKVPHECFIVWESALFWTLNEAKLKRRITASPTPYILTISLSSV